MTDVRELDEYPELLPAAIDPLTRPLTRRARSTRMLGRPVGPRSPLTDADFLAGVGTGEVDADVIPSHSGLRHDRRAENSSPAPREVRRSRWSARAGVFDATRLRRPSVGERPPHDPDGDAASGGASRRADGRAGTTGSHCHTAMASRRAASGHTDAWRHWCGN